MKMFLAILIFSVQGHAYVLDSNSGSSQFKAVGRPAAIKIVGKGAGPFGDISMIESGAEFLLSGDIKIDLESLDTGIGLRDKHMKDKYLEVSKSKVAVLKLQDVKIPKESVTTSGEVKVQGILTLHGADKPVDVTMATKKEGNKIKVTSQFQIKLSDFSIEIPSYAGITVADIVELNVDTQVSDEILKKEVK